MGLELLHYCALIVVLSFSISFLLAVLLLYVGMHKQCSLPEWLCIQGSLRVPRIACLVTRLVSSPHKVLDCSVYVPVTAVPLKTWSNLWSTAMFQASFQWVCGSKRCAIG
jgi:hypothetical protein